MGNRLRILVFLLIFLTLGCSVQDKAIHQTEEAEDEKDWKKLAVCLCIYKATPFPNDLKRKEGSVSAYLQTSKSYDLETFEKTEEFVDEYLIRATYNSKTNSSLSLMKCLDFYESKELESFVKGLEKVKN